MSRSWLVTVLAFLALPAVAGAQEPDPPVPGSHHFTIERLADGVWAAIASDSGYAICNAAIVDLGGATLVFDPFLTPDAADDLRAAAEALTGRSVTYVALSHWHNDHVRGAQSFPGAVVLGTTTTRRLIAELEPPEAEAEKSFGPVRLERARADLDTATTGSRRREAVFWIEYYVGMLASHDELRFRTPDVTFDGRMAVHGSARGVELLEMDGHTESDAVLWLPEERIVFMGDLLFIERHPYLPHGDHVAHRDALHATIQLEPTIVVAGHGPTGGIEGLRAMVRYLDDMEAHGRVLAATGADEARARATPPPPAYRDWWFRNFVPINTWTMVQRARAAAP